MDNLIEMKALATQAANDTLEATSGATSASKLQPLANDINQIANQTVFQDTELLNGDGNTGSLTLTFQVGEREADTLTAELKAVNVGELFAGGTSGTSVNLGAATGAGGGLADGAAITASVASTSGQGALSFTDDATASDYRAFISAVDGAIDSMAERVNDVGITQSSLSVREVTLSQSISANSSAASRIMDADFAKEQSESVRLQILQQTATSALAQANMGPQSVLGFIG
jgi:flagellin